MAKNFKAWPQSRPRTLNYPDMPVFSFLDQTADRVPSRLAIIFSGMELTYSELKSLADRFAGALDALGVKKGDRVAVHLPNCPQFAIAYYGILKIGAIFTPLSPMYSAREARRILSDSGAETLISLDLVYPGIQPVIDKTSVKRVISTSIADCFNPVTAPLKSIGKLEVPRTLDFADLLSKHEPFEKQVDINPGLDLAHLAYTGGTTGAPKGVMLTHANVIANSLQALAWFIGGEFKNKDGLMMFENFPGTEPDEASIQLDNETALVIAPWFHAMGTIGYLNVMAAGGITMVVFPRFEAKEYIGAVSKYKATMLGGAPQLYIPLYNLPDFNDYDLSCIKLALSGAAPLPQTILDKMLDTFEGTVCEGWGMTECTMVATFNPPYRKAIKQGSVGLPIFDTECKIIDLLTEEDMPPGMEGELCIKGPQVMKGYWNNPEATEEILNDGWLLTGDIGWEDEDGYFYITDRRKDMIIYKGYNVYPREIEEVIFQHPAVEQCAVVGKTDEQGGEAPVAFVQLKQGQKATGEEIMQHTNIQVASYKKIREVHFLDEMPIGEAGKVLRKDLRDRLYDPFI